jgi:hypothetical protein
MKWFVVLAAGFLTVGCNQTAQQGGNVSAGLASPEPQAQAAAQEDIQSLPPIYSPLVDMHRKSTAKYVRDHAECRRQAEPQERAARAAMTQQQTGAAMQVAGALVDFLPVSGFKQARQMATVRNVAQDVGGVTQDAGAAKGADATEAYMLVVNTCLQHRGYVLLRA